MSKNVFDIGQELMSNAYPGRGIILGRTSDNKKNVIAYFIMGRSENSRNRVFTETEDVRPVEDGRPVADHLSSGPPV